MHSPVQRTLEAITHDIADVRKAIGQARKNAKLKAQRAQSAGRRTSLYQTVLAVHCLSEGTVELAAHFWIGRRMQCGCRNEDVSWGRAVSVVSEWIENASVEDFHEARTPQTPGGVRARSAALQFISGASAARWAARMVRERGHAPSSREVWEESENLLTADELQGHSTVERVPTSSKVRSWARRWRRRWLFKRGKVKLREHFPVEELRAKAGRETLPCSAFCSCGRSRF